MTLAPGTGTPDVEPGDARLARSATGLLGVFNLSLIHI